MPISFLFSFKHPSSVSSSTCADVLRLHLMDPALAQLDLQYSTHDLTI
jgi:hypothetical protein